jgi:hypothetical protein
MSYTIHLSYFFIWLTLLASLLQSAETYPELDRASIEKINALEESGNYFLSRTIFKAYQDQQDGSPDLAEFPSKLLKSFSDGSPPHRILFKKVGNHYRPIQQFQVVPQDSEYFDHVFKEKRLNLFFDKVWLDPTPASLFELLAISLHSSGTPYVSRNVEKLISKNSVEMKKSLKSSLDLTASLDPELFKVLISNPKWVNWYRIKSLSRLFSVSELVESIEHLLWREKSSELIKKSLGYLFSSLSTPKLISILTECLLDHRLRTAVIMFTDPRIQPKITPDVVKPVFQTFTGTKDPGFISTFIKEPFLSQLNAKQQEDLVHQLLDLDVQPTPDQLTHLNPELMYIIADIWVKRSFKGDNVFENLLWDEIIPFIKGYQYGHLLNVLYSQKSYNWVQMLIKNKKIVQKIPDIFLNDLMESFLKDNFTEDFFLEGFLSPSFIVRATPRHASMLFNLLRGNHPALLRLLFNKPFMEKLDLSTRKNFESWILDNVPTKKIVLKRLVDASGYFSLSKTTWEALFVTYLERGQMDFVSISLEHLISLSSREEQRIYGSLYVETANARNSPSVHSLLQHQEKLHEIRRKLYTQQQIKVNPSRPGRLHLTNALSMQPHWRAKSLQTFHFLTAPSNFFWMRHNFFV